MLHNNDGSSEGDDVLLFDSLPEKRRCLEGCHPFRAVLPALETLGLKAWNKEKAKWRVVSAPGTEHHKPMPLGGVLTAATPGKRGQVLGEIEENGHDGSSDSYTAVTDCDEPDAVVFVNCRQLPTAKAPLACPFYRLDLVRYHSCMWGMELSDIRSLQQHVIVNHCRPEYCPICWTVFDSTAGRNCHIVARTCRKSDDLSSHTASLLLGVSEDQVEQLLALEERCRTGKGKRKGKKGREGGERRSGNKTTRAAAVSEEEKWFLIWGILFPTAPRPASAYLSSPREREAVGMRHFWDKAGPRLLAGLLKRKKMLRWEDPQEEVALAALHTSVLKGMMESSGLIYSGCSPGTGIE